ncbi:MAG: phosphoribosylamine--glycine ligase [Chlamydiales bacterium]|jgi:phosphoribosylamine--glycine ligase
MRIVVIGGGGREHALTWKLGLSNEQSEIFLLPGNPSFANSYGVDITDFDEIKKFCSENTIDLVVVGPEVPLANGIVDSFKDEEIYVFGPNSAAARLESSKVWSKDFMKKYGVATAVYKHCKSISEARKASQESAGDVVIKYDGLAGGKGVHVCYKMTEVDAALETLKSQYGEEVELIVEERLEGEEVSLVGITDGKVVKLLSPSQDHKRAFDGDKGPNTGGMGAYCPVPFWSAGLEEDINQKIIQPTLDGLKKEGLSYCGIIYFGVMITKSGPKLLEYNVRFGDPEAQVILPALKSDLVPLIMACFHGTLRDFEIEYQPGYFVTVVLASGGYPGKYELGKEIKGLEDLRPETLVFHAGTKLEGDKFLTDGGRVLDLVDHGASLEEAVQKIYEECAKIDFDGLFYRKDIGGRLLSV